MVGAVVSRRIWVVVAPDTQAAIPGARHAPSGRMTVRRNNHPHPPSVASPPLDRMPRPIRMNRYVHCCRDRSGPVSLVSALPPRCAARTRSQFSNSCGAAEVWCAGPSCAWTAHDERQGWLLACPAHRTSVARPANRSRPLDRLIEVESVSRSDCVRPSPLRSRTLRICRRRCARGVRSRRSARRSRAAIAT
jgi:hypothetical protein